MHRLFVVLLAAACGRVGFDPLFDGGTGDGTGDGGGGAGDGGGGGSVACTGATPACTATAGSLSLSGTFQAGNTTALQGNGLAGSCGGAGANEFTIELIALASGTFTFSTEGSEFDTVLYLLDSCTGSELVCADTPGGGERIQHTVTAGETVIAVVDGAAACGVFRFRAGTGF